MRSTRLAAAAAMGFAAALLAPAFDVPALAAPRLASTCAEDDPIPTPPGYAGWERSSVVVWQALEDRGAVVPDIEEDRSHAPPAWWRYPSPLRSAELLAEEARDPKGLYEAVAPGDLKTGDVLVRVRGAGACGKMALLAGRADDQQWVTIEDGEKEPQATRTGNPTFFVDGKSLRPEAAAFRIRVKKDTTLGHVRELDRDLVHLERTIAERPPLVVPKGRSAVDEKVHDLVDEAGSLAADPAFEVERRALLGRSLALAAALDGPGAAAAAAAVLDDSIQRAPSRGDAAVARASVYLLSGDSEKALHQAEAAKAVAARPDRLTYVLGRALLAAGKTADGLAAMKRYLDEEPGDVRARKLAETGGRTPALAPPPPPVDDPTGAPLRLTATPERVALRSTGYDFAVEWPVTWRVVGIQSAPETGILVQLALARVLREDGEAERATAMLLVQRPGAAEAAALAKKGARNLFPEAKLKSLPPLIPGSRRESFRDRGEKGEGPRLGEVTTLERSGTVYILVVNASAAGYPKVKDAYAALVKSLTVGRTPAPGAGK
jgi:tetratricopeptide (TPR) repeat protein